MDKNMKNELDKAVEYASNSSSIEDMALTEEEKEALKQSILAGKSDDSFLYTVVTELGEKENENKIRK